jgi:rhodanese-related sulfurtransferase
MMTRFAFLVCGLALSGWVAVGLCAGEADEYPVPLMDGKPFLHVMHDGRSIRVERIQDPNFELKGYYAKTARKCPPFCIHAMQVTPDVVTVGEVELFEFMETRMRDGTGVLIDARTPEWYNKGTIPGSASFPFTEFTKPPGDPAWDRLFPGFGARLAQEPGFMQQTLESLGLGEQKLQSGKWDYADAKDLVIFCNGPACDQSPRAIAGLLAAGYPAQKLFYYRGGMQMWELWGLTTLTPQEQ